MEPSLPIAGHSNSPQDHDRPSSAPILIEADPLPPSVVSKPVISSPRSPAAPPTSVTIRDQMPPKLSPLSNSSSLPNRRQSEAQAVVARAVEPSKLSKSKRKKMRQKKAKDLRNDDAHTRPPPPPRSSATPSTSPPLPAVPRPSLQHGFVTGGSPLQQTDPLTPTRAPAPAPAAILPPLSLERLSSTPIATPASGSETPANSQLSPPQTPSNPALGLRPEDEPVMVCCNISIAFPTCSSNLVLEEPTIRPSGKMCFPWLTLPSCWNCYTGH